MIIDQKPFNELIFDAFTKKITWLEASSRYPLTDVIDTFRSIRAAFRRLLNGLTDAQVAYIAPNTPTWSISEAVTHIIYSQNGYYNQLLDSSASELPHIAEAAQGFGEGAKVGIPAEELRLSLTAATTRIEFAFSQTLGKADLTKTTTNTLFGEVNYAAWLLLMSAHEVDHYRQAAVMRRLARAAYPA
ncbi:MAG TPA: DinB family protein [Aggregatilineales bacterium]|nr:DinB family protein [Anaerolineales bacterium]HRE48638.1 DinB family protein [Aggregatilineales bacterium]